VLRFWLKFIFRLKSFSGLRNFLLLLLLLFLLLIISLVTFLDFYFLVFLSL
jgi:hypothetical protein